MSSLVLLFLCHDSEIDSRLVGLNVALSTTTTGRNSIQDDLNPPGPITLRDPTGNPITSIRITSLVDIGVYTFESNAEDAWWSVSPRLSGELYFDSSKRTLSGRTTKVFTAKQYNVTVTNDAGTSYLVFTIESMSCKEGFYMINHVDNFISGRVSLSHNGKLIEDFKLNNYYGDKYYCLPKGTIELKIVCTYAYEEGCFGSVRTTENVTYIYLNVPAGQTQNKSTAMVATEAPRIVLGRDTIITTRGTRFEIPIKVEGIFSDLVFTPSLPTDVRYNKDQMVLKGSFEAKGIYEYEISTSNNAGSVSKKLSFHIGVCPNGSEFYSFYCYGGEETHFTISSTKNEVVAERTITNSGYDEVECLPSGEYYMRRTVNTTGYMYPLQIYDSNNQLIESFEAMSNDKNGRERFVVGDIVPERSVFKYWIASSVDTKWTQVKYKDHDWNEGMKGAFGSYNPTTQSVFIRKQFTIRDVSSYAQVSMDIEVSDYAIVYLNGMEIRRCFNSELSRKRILLDASLLQKGKNQLAIELHGNGSTREIQFDMKVHLITSQCLKPSFKGTPSSDEKEVNPSHSPADAFEGDNFYWESTMLPVTLQYSLSDSIFAMPSMIRLSTPEMNSGHPIDFSVYGVVFDKETNMTVAKDEIASVHSKVFMWHKDTEDVPLDPRRPYNAIHIHFRDSRNHTVVRVGGISFKECQLSSCKKRIGWSAKRVGEVSYSRCPFGTYGINQRVCARDNVKPAWAEDRSMCLAKHAKSGWAYIDTGLKMEGGRPEMMSMIKNQAIRLITSKLTVWKEQIEFAYVYQVSVEPLVMETVLRLTVEKAIGEYVEGKMKLYVEEFLKEFGEELRKYDVTDIQMTFQPVLRLPFPWMRIVWILVGVVLVIVAFIMGILVMNIKSRSDGSKRKQLKKGMKSGEKARLI